MILQRHARVLKVNATGPMEEAVFLGMVINTHGELVAVWQTELETYFVCKTTLLKEVKEIILIPSRA